MYFDKNKISLFSLKFALQNVEIRVTSSILNVILLLYLHIGKYLGIIGILL